MIEVHGTDEQLPSLFAALSKVLGEIGPVTKDNTATARGGRTYSYADLTAVLDAIRPELPKHDLWYSQNPGGIRAEGNLIIQTIDAIVGHGGGAYILYRTDIPISQQTEQGMGIGTSYGRRYQAVGNWSVGMEDNDGQHTPPSRSSATRAGNPSFPMSDSRDAERDGPPFSSGHLAQAALELGATPVVRPSQFRQQIDDIVEEMKTSDTPYPSKGLIGMHLNGDSTMAAIDANKLNDWVNANPDIPAIELLRVAAQHAASVLPAGPAKVQAQQWLGANS